jgi:hypothetical protein
MKHLFPTFILKMHIHPDPLAATLHCISVKCLNQWTELINKDLLIKVIYYAANPFIHKITQRLIEGKVKVEQSHLRPAETLKCPGSWDSHIWRQSAHEVGKIVSPTHQPLYLQEIILVLVSVSGWVKPSAKLRPEKLCQRKVPMREFGVEPTTF